MSGKMTPAQIRGARAMLGWSMMDLASAAKVSVATVKRMEIDGAQPLPVDVRLTVWDVFGAAGVRFIDDDGEGAGLMLRTP